MNHDLERRVRIVRCGREIAAAVDYGTGAPMLIGHKEHVAAVLYDAGYRRMTGGFVWVRTRSNRWNDREARS